MPLLIIPGHDALAKRKTNSYASWPARETTYNRVEPYATPNFTNHFSISPKDQIFTIGSCFAREIEVALADRGFSIPALELVKNFMASESLGLGNSFNRSFLNQYGVPSIFNQIHQAVELNGDLPTNLYAYEISAGKFVDMDMPAFVRPAPLEHVVNRRNALMSCTKEILKCNTIIITLGLSELWWDNGANCYRNTSVLPRILDAEQNRFELHVLSYQDIFSYLSRALNLIKLINPQSRILLTVSPVPMNYTYTSNDVMVANTYSKSVLRAAVEEAINTFPNVFYYPSYETVILSQRDLAWENDMMHVQPKMVKKIVSRMIAKYAVNRENYAASDIESIRLDFEDILKQSSKLIKEFIGKNLNLISTDPALAYASIEQYLRFSNIESAKELYELSNKILDPDISSFANALIHLADHDHKQALLFLRSIDSKSKITTSGAYCRAKATALLALNEMADLILICNFWSKIWPNRGEPYLMVAKGYQQNGDILRSKSSFLMALETENSNTQILLEYLEFLIQNGDLENAREMTELVTPSTQAEKLALKRVQGMLGI
jgi:hypothetical protein